MAKDFYATLGVSKTADDKAIKNAYRKLAREHHPDVNPNNPKAETRFKEISAAYDVLSDPEKRKMYDKFGDNYDKVPPGYEQYGGQGGGMPGGFSGGGVNLEDIFAQAQRGGGANFQTGGQAGGIGDVFGQIFGGFGGQGKRRGPEKGGDVEQTVEISFEESIKGAQRTLNFIIRNDNGREDKRNVTVKIPALISDGATVKVSGKGASSPTNGPNGDLFLKVRVKSDGFWKRDGMNLEIEVPVSFTEAALGASIPVPTRTGEVSLKIPEGTQAGMRFRLSGRGLKNEKSGATGDLFVTVKVTVPKNLSERERELIEELKSLRTENVREALPKGLL